ncbi:MAG TPA: hypothetical protein VMK12_08510 [Anaeromyxobacteraceae bacterium]|nr:hypothetical protein [Anaeromyxobacteraceae bacterium]
MTAEMAGFRLPNRTLLWWGFLCVAALVNAAAWGASAWWLAPQPDIEATRRALLWLSAVYVAGCAFRSLLPMIDVPRYCLLDTPISRIFVGRSVATVAELAFVAQWALLMHEAGAVRAAVAVLVIIVVAEILSWLAVLTRNDLFHAAENALWAVAAALATVFLASRWGHQGEIGHKVIVVAIACAALYVAFMGLYVVPMYVRRWRAEGVHLSPRVGLLQLLGRCAVERDWGHWRQDAAWLTPYFTVCVWLSITLAYVPSLRS